LSGSIQIYCRNLIAVYMMMMNRLNLDFYSHKNIHQLTHDQLW